MKRIVFIFTVLSLLTGCLSPDKQAVKLKIMTYNIKHGKGLDNIPDLSRAAQIIKSQSPDLCGLQEIDKFCSRSDSIDQAGYLARATNMKGTFGKFMDLQGGEYGMATLSALPLISTKVLALPEGKYEPRSSIVHEVEITEDHSIVFANVHFEWIGGEEGRINRLKQAKALVDYINSLNKASVITGDFNCTPGSQTMNYFKEQGFVFAEKGEDNLSFQGRNKAEIDHVIFRNTKNLEFELKSIKLLDEPLASDHRPLVAELSLTLK